MLLNVRSNWVAQGFIQSGILSVYGRREYNLSSSLCHCFTVLKVKNHLLAATPNATYFNSSRLLFVLPSFTSAISLHPIVDHHPVATGDCFYVFTGHSFIGTGGYF